jgi:hypothetical protein
MLNAKTMMVMQTTSLKIPLAFSLQHLAFSPDQLRNAMNQLQTLLYAA